ncbi:MAG: aldose 1-epimerase [Isosphaeraceae bacterium]
MEATSDPPRRATFATPAFPDTPDAEDPEMAHRITTEPHGDRTVYTLHDDETGASASVLPSYGFNLFDLKLPVAGQPRAVLACAPDFADKPSSPGRNGIPVLFPFPNRIKDAKYTFQGKEYKLPANSGANAIHGFALNVPWDVVAQSTDGGAAKITGRYQISRNTPNLLEHWPADAALEIQYALAGRKLTMTVSVSNPTDRDLPYGFGIHPYFNCPFSAQGDLTRTNVEIPASEYWELDSFIPTGVRKPVDARLDFRKGHPMAGLKLDDVLTGLEFTNGTCVCRLVDLELGGEFRMSFDRNIRELVVFTPPWYRNAIAIEPYTQATDAVNLTSRGVDGGLRVLPHGKTDTFVIQFETTG